MRFFLLCLSGQACAEHLVSEGFTSPSSMGAHVNSAGGLLAGVMANVRPGLFSAMVMKVCVCLCVCVYVKEKGGAIKTPKGRGGGGGCVHIDYKAESVGP